MGIVSEEKGERRDFGRTMGNGIMLEFSGGEELGPLMGVVGTKDTKIGFDFLIGSFGLSICLRMICDGESNIIFEDSGKFLGECRGELGSSVGNESIVKSEAFEYVVEKELGNTIRVNGL